MPQLRRGWTTGACATAALKAALLDLWGGEQVTEIMITLPRGETPTFGIAHRAGGDGWREIGITKDAGDDPDVTHGALIIARVEVGAQGQGVQFRAGAGVGIVTKPGLPIAPGEPAINPVPRQMMIGVVAELAAQFGTSADVVVTISVPGGEALAAKTWNPRLGIVGGLSILGTTGIVRPFSCAAWIASIHRGIDVARATGLTHVAGATGAQSEAAVQKLYNLPDGALLDMGDFVGGMVKYLKRHPVPRLTVAGGVGKMVKLAQGAIDLHSDRSQVDFAALAVALNQPEIGQMNTVLEVHSRFGPPVADYAAHGALLSVRRLLARDDIVTDVLITNRTGRIIGRAE